MDLTALQDSTFLRSLGWAIANSLWQGAALYALYYIIIASYKNASSKFKNNISTAFLFSLFTWFAVTFLIRLINLKTEIIYESEIEKSLVSEYLTIHPEKISLNFFADTAIQTLPYLSLAYLLLLLILAVRLINSYRNTSFIKNYGLLKPGVEWRLFTEKVANQISIGKKVQIWLSKYVDVPATLGFFKPVILIPVASVNQLTTEQLEAIILHELSHIKRNDYLVNLFISIVETVLFFNPFVVLLIKVVKKERENCCDDFVLQYQYDRYSYASALLSLEQSRNQQWNLALTSTSGKKQLLSRIKRIMEVNNKNGNLNYGQKLLALLFVTGIIGSIAWLSPEKNINKTYKNSKTTTISVAAEKESTGNKTQNTIKENGSTEITKVSEFLQPKGIIKKNILQNFNSQLDYDDNAELTQHDNEALFFALPESEKIEDRNENTHSNNLQSNPPLYQQYPLQSFLSAPSLKNFNLNMLRKEYLPDIKFFDNLDFDIKQLEKSIEDANRSIASLDLEKINEQIKVSLQSTNQSPEAFREIKRLNIEKIINDAMLEELEKNKILEETLKTYSHLHINENKREIENIRRKAASDRDILLKKRFMITDTDNPEKNFNRIVLNNLENPEELRAIKKGKKSQKISSLFNYDFNVNNENNIIETTVEIKNKKVPVDKMSLEFKDGVVYINGEKINTSNTKKIQAMFKTKKFVIAFDENEPKAQIED